MELDPYGYMPQEDNKPELCTVTCITSLQPLPSNKIFNSLLNGQKSQQKTRLTYNTNGVFVYRTHTNGVLKMLKFRVGKTTRMSFFCFHL